MSDEYASGEMSLTPQKLMPRSATITEHHRVLNLNAMHTGNQTSTIKAHKVRIDGIHERVGSLEEFREGFRDDFSELKEELVKQRESTVAIANELQKSMMALGGIVGKHSEELAAQKGGMELKKVLVIALFGLLGTCVTAFGGYAWGHTPSGPAYVAPTHQQALEIDRKIKESDPNNLQRIGQ
jgi:hypothetical protein